MDNATYYKELETRVAVIRELRRQCPSFAKGIIGETLFKEDLFFCAALDRNVQLSEGFIKLLQQRNLSCVGALLRMQMDNCMRTYAAFIAANKDAVIDCIIHGKKIRDLADIDGKKMTDAHLKKKMSAFNTSFPDVYDKASGYVHFSDMAFYQTVVSCNDNIIEWQIGQALQERFNPLLLEAADAFIHFTKIHYKMLQAVVDSKQRYDALHEADAD
ncbi:MAG: hypothetical protein PUB00_07000 [Clostridiales bacterium]|nr:hypothetical protein [Clostridiales bacterium]